MNRGKFIVLEGVNSCGKTTIQNLLIARLIKEFPDKSSYQLLNLHMICQSVK